MVAVQNFNCSQQASLIVDLEHVCQDLIYDEKLNNLKSKTYKQISE